MTGHMGGLSLGAGAMKSQGLIGLAEKSRRDWPDRNYEAFMNLGLPQPKGRGDFLGQGLRAELVNHAAKSRVQSPGATQLRVNLAKKAGIRVSGKATITQR
jgi:hypothetical protein